MLKHSELQITQQDVIEGLPSHLRRFVQIQDSERYTARDHAAWRFLMKHLTQQLSHTAHPVFREGLAGTGIPIDRIPSIDEMNNCLAKLGWRAVTVNGFIPPAIFMEFQARKILPIAIEMRPAEQLLYTPAPDFLHESTGHAPFLVDTDYAEFLQRFGEVGMYAIVSNYDVQKYEAIHLLSSLEKSPSPDPDALALAKSNLAKLNSIDRDASEAELLARLHWWTVEYGLVGSLDDYRIFGAGLLSSLGESQHCFNSASVEKLPLTVNAVSTDYDITRAQPQLFVTQSCKHLTQVLNEFAKSMSFNTGGVAAVRRAIAAGTVCTARYDTGIEVSGVLCEVLCDAVDNPIYLRAAGPSQIAFNHQQLPGHGSDRHSDGFGSPIGGLKDMPRCLSECTIDELRGLGIETGKAIRLEYLSGISVTGVLSNILRHHQKSILFTIADCLVTTLDGRVLFDPKWGEYDLAIGTSITSVYGGAADKQTFPNYHRPPDLLEVTDAPDAAILKTYTLLDQVEASMPKLTSESLPSEVSQALEIYPQEWLLRVELTERGDALIAKEMKQQLRAIQSEDPALKVLIDLALS